MAKFIDIEKATHEYYKNPSYHQLCKVLNDAPIVKVIPVEWIKDEIDYLEGTGRFELSEYLGEMLEEWEKENE